MRSVLFRAKVVTSFASSHLGWVVILALLGGAPIALSAQSIPDYRSSRVGLSDHRASSRGAQHSTTRLDPASSETHWLRGGVIGGTISGLLGLLMYSAIVTRNDTRDTTSDLLVGMLGSVAIGFGIGALIGGQFKK